MWTIYPIKVCLREAKGKEYYKIKFKQEQDDDKDYDNFKKFKGKIVEYQDKVKQKLNLIDQKITKYLDGTYAKVDANSNLPEKELYDKNGVKFNGVYRNVELDAPEEEFFDKNGKRLDGKYKKDLSEKPVMELDILYIDFYDKNINQKINMQK